MLIDPALHARGWTEDLIRREETAGAYFLAHPKRTTGNATIDRRVLAAFPLMAPNLGEQERVADTLAAEMACADRLRRSLEASRTDLRAMGLVLLRRMASGEL